MIHIFKAEKMEKAHQKFSGLELRIISGIILGPLMLAVIIWGGIPFLLTIGAAAIISLNEWYRMARAGNRFIPDMAIGCTYLCVSLASFVVLRMMFAEGLFLVLGLILCVWASDTGAYFSGKKIGGPKLAPKISPNKTWAGLGGAMIFSGLALACVFALVPWMSGMLSEKATVDLEQNALGMVFIMGCLFGAVGQAGDLFVSRFKRRVGIKDTGNIIPGHGGLLDRIDALLLVTPVFLLSYALLSP